MRQGIFEASIRDRLAKIFVHEKFQSHGLWISCTSNESSDLRHPAGLVKSQIQERFILHQNFQGYVMSFEVY